MLKEFSVAQSSFLQVVQESSPFALGNNWEEVGDHFAWNGFYMPVNSLIQQILIEYLLNKFQALF